MNQIIGSCDVLMITLDSLRFDVAQHAFQSNKTPNLARRLPESGWERRHSPGNFTFAAHHAFFAGFLPTPISNGPHPRLFASKFEGSETTTSSTFTFDEDNLVTALANRSYRTICIGGVGFFNKKTALGCVLPNLFQESHWSVEFGVTCPTSAENQIQFACDRLKSIYNQQRVFLFINISAIHQPNYFYVEHATQDSCETQSAALAYVDRALVPLMELFQARGKTFCIMMSDHGTAYGESGYRGHRLNHQVVGDVPYADFIIDQNA